MGNIMKLKNDIIMKVDMNEIALLILDLLLPFIISTLKYRHRTIFFQKNKQIPFRNIIIVF